MMFDIFLIVITGSLLIIRLFSSASLLNQIIAALAFIGLIPVAISAIKSLVARKISVDLLAAIALVFSLISQEWVSAAFITLMLAFARSHKLAPRKRSRA